VTFRLANTCLEEVKPRNQNVIASLPALRHESPILSACRLSLNRTFFPAPPFGRASKPFHLIYARRLECETS
jgi:hypothetical protein